MNVKWAAPFDKRRLDARLTNGLRYFSRDLGTVTNIVEPDYQGADLSGQLIVGDDVDVEDLAKPEQRGGVAAWNDFSPTANRARESLVVAAGINVPSAGFVVMFLAAYLVVLVPLNWLFFNAIGRIEWAWAAAPVIAILCAVAVVRLAQLDIGFARSVSEIAVMELQRGYSRAHLTRYTALYTSLSTTYDLQFDDLSSLVQPFPDADFRMVPGQTRSTVTYRRNEDVRLGGFTVSSNTTDMVHSEQMYDLGAAIVLGESSLGRKQVVNRTNLNLSDVGILYNQVSEDGEARVRICWIGDLPAGQSASVSFGPFQGVEALADEREKASGQTVSGQLDLASLFELAEDPEYLEPGEIRLVGRVTSLLEGRSIQPTASQTQIETLLVAHLEYGKFPEPQPDENTRAEFSARSSIMTAPVE